MTERTTNFNITNGDQGHGSHSSSHCSMKASAVLRTVPSRSGGPPWAALGYAAVWVTTGIRQADRVLRWAWRSGAEVGLPAAGLQLRALGSAGQRCGGYNWAERLGFVGLS
jgi:hypothetical protein